ncbi:hypothetical protein BGZ54_005612, partial [Gamsiella multidivaricata]
MNLAVQAMLGKGGLGAEAPRDAEFMDVEDNDDAEGLVRNSIAKEEDEEDTNEPRDDNSSIKLALQKLRRGIVKIRRSPSRLENFKELTATPDRKQGLSPLLD